MNKQQLALKIRDTLRQYREQGSDSPCRKNHIVLNAGNTELHEMNKCEICYALLNGYLPFNHSYSLGETIINTINYKKSPDFKTLSFITEAVDRKTGKRRDIIILETDTIVEVVNTHMDDKLMQEYKDDDVLIIKV